jgi:hypothetical protein
MMVRLPEVTMNSLSFPRSGLVLLAPFCLALPLSACAAAPSDDDVQPIQIDSVEVQVGQARPAQVTAHVQGVLGDGCATLHSQEQKRSGDSVTITILRERPRDAICTQLAKLYDEQIPLEGTFPPGDYVLHVNAFDTAFRVE